MVQTENNTIQRLRSRLELVEDEKKSLEVIYFFFSSYSVIFQLNFDETLQTKLGTLERGQQEFPRLLDSMLEDKNEEIDHLKDQLSKREKQLEIYLSLNLDESQLKELLKQAEPKNSARTLSDILSINSECEEFPEAIREVVNLTQTIPYNISHLKTSADGSQLKYTQQMTPIATIEPKTGADVPRLELQSRSLSQSPSVTGVELKSPTSGENSDNLTKSRNVVESEVNDDNLSKEHSSAESQESDKINECPRHGISKNEPKSAEHQNQTIIKELENQLGRIREELESKTEKLNEREAELEGMQRDLLELRKELKETIDTLTWDKFFYKDQFELTQASESKIKNDLLEVENTLKLKTEELDEYKGRMQTNEKIVTELNEENSRLRQEFEEKLKSEVEKLEITISEKIQELKNLKEIIFEKDITIETLSTRNVEIENENKQLYEFKTKFETCRNDLSNCQMEIQRLSEGLNNRDMLIRRLEEMARRSSWSGASSPSENKDQEIHHLQEHLKEKDKVIRQMSDDSKSLQRALETIQNKMRESGNVVELRKKLKDERKVNQELKDIVDKLNDEIEQLRPGSTR